MRAIFPEDEERDGGMILYNCYARWQIWYSYLNVYLKDIVEREGERQ